MFLKIDFTENPKQCYFIVTCMYSISNIISLLRRPSKWRFEIYKSSVYSVIANYIFISNYIFRSRLIMSMDLPTPFFSTCPVLLTPPHPLSDSSPTNSSPFAEANLAVNDLIRAIKNRTNKLQTSDPAELPSTTKSPKIAFPTFRGKPLAMALYQQKRKRVARVPGQLEVRKRRSRKPPSVPPVRDAKGKFLNLKSTGPALPTEPSSMDTTRTPGSSEHVPFIMTEPVSPSPLDPEPISQFSASSTAEADAPTTTQAVVLDVGSPLLTGLTLSMPTPDELASFICNTFIIPKLTENKPFLLCRDQLFHQYYHTHLVLFFRVNIGTTCVSFSQLDT